MVKKYKFLHIYIFNNKKLAIDLCTLKFKEILDFKFSFGDRNIKILGCWFLLVCNVSLEI